MYVGYREKDKNTRGAPYGCPSNCAIAVDITRSWQISIQVVVWATIWVCCSYIAYLGHGEEALRSTVATTHEPISILLFSNSAVGYTRACTYMRVRCWWGDGNRDVLYLLPVIVYLPPFISSVFCFADQEGKLDTIKNNRLGTEGVCSTFLVSSVHKSSPTVPQSKSTAAVVFLLCAASRRRG